MAAEDANIADGWEDAGKIFMGRVRNPAGGAYITQASLSTITLTVKNPAKVTTLTASLTPANVVFDALQTSPAWTRDAIGYNFLHECPASAFPEPGVYTVEYLFDPASGENFPLVWHYTVKPIEAS